MTASESHKVSVVIPIYNSEKTIAETLQSLLLQTHQNWEALVVLDEGTQDASLTIIKSFKDPRIRVLHSVSKGVSKARNLAIKCSTGRFLAFLDSDDLWHKDKLLEQTSAMIQNSWAFSVTGFSRINENSEQISSSRMPRKMTRYTDLLKDNSIACLTVMLDQAQINSVEFTESHQEDFILWLKILRQGFICHGLQKDLAMYRVLSNSRSSRVNRPLNRWKIMRNIEGLSLGKSLYYLCIYVMMAVAKRI
jgi:glycosyltransferase involved in cell wall biosynthesis